MKVDGRDGKRERVDLVWMQGAVTGRQSASLAYSEQIDLIQTMFFADEVDTVV